jgi:serine O-acetyltransferase
MRLELPRDQLVRLVVKQVNNLFFLDEDSELGLLAPAVEWALERCEYCFSHIDNKYYNRGGETYFNPFHSGQYTIFLYYLSNSIYRGSGATAGTLADRVYYLNKCLNGVDLFYEVELPRVFFLDHPVGSVLGRAAYGEFFSFTQDCTVGQNKGLYPVIGRNVKMMSGSKIVGRCNVGDNVILSANTYLKDDDIPACSLVFGSSPSLIVKTKDESYFM